jgi:hypothetical protein
MDGGAYNERQKHGFINEDDRPLAKECAGRLDNGVRSTIAWPVGLAESNLLPSGWTLNERRMLGKTAYQ